MNLKRIIALLLVLGIVLAFIPAVVFAADVQTTPMYRLYNPNSGEHFYTGSTVERDNLTKAGWSYEGIAWNAPIYGGDPVYRVYNPNSGDHHYTMSKDEVDILLGLGWQYENVAWNSASSGNVPQYRLYNPNADLGSHHYTSSTEERNHLVSLGWKLEGIGWYGIGGAEPAKPEGVTLTLDHTEITLEEGGSFQLNKTYTGTGPLTWGSSDESIASVTWYGEVFAESEGVAVITVTNGTISASCLVTVTGKAYEKEATSIEMYSCNGPFYDGVTKYAGDKLDFAVYTMPVESNRKIVVTSSDPSVVLATYPKTYGGMPESVPIRLEFLSAGSAVITLTSGDGAVTQSYTINVKADYDFNPGEGLLSPEEFASYATKVMCEDGFVEKNNLGSWRLLTLTASELTFTRAVSLGRARVHEWWPNGIRSCQIVYVGQNEDGNYQFHTCWGG